MYFSFCPAHLGLALRTCLGTCPVKREAASERLTKLIPRMFVRFRVAEGISMRGVVALPC